MGDDVMISREPATMREVNEQLRIERHGALRDTARQLIANNGLSVFTMQQLAEDVGCSIGSVYRYFPSKHALIAELQRDAIDRLATSFLLSQSHVDRLLEEWPATGSGRAALVRLMAAARFWTSARTVFPQEIELSSLMFTDPTQALDDDDAGRVVPAGMRLLELASGLLGEAAAAGAIRPGGDTDRALIVIAGTFAVMLTSNLGRWDADLFAGERLAEQMTWDLLLGWGADHESLEAGEALIAQLAAEGRLVPSV